MLDLARLQNIRLSNRPLGQLIVANLGLAVDYRVPRRTRIVIEGAEHFPRGGAFLAMNHTDRYNYWPLQYGMYRRGIGFTATWVKGKYYENRFIGRFMDSMNNIPLPSRGYVITTEFRKALGRPPTDAEYRVLRDLVDGRHSLDEVLDGDVPSSIRQLLGADPKAALIGFDQLFRTMMREVVELNRRAIEDLGLYVLVFPEGTRRRRLGRGHHGLAQMAQYLGSPIVPIGCNGSDKLYPGNSPLSKGGEVIYRVGEPLPVDGAALSPYRVRGQLPFTEEAERTHKAELEAITRVVMSAIEGLLDPEYRPGTDAGAEERGAKRFI